MEEELYNFVNGNWKQAHDYLDQDGTVDDVAAAVVA